MDLRSQSGSASDNGRLQVLCLPVDSPCWNWAGYVHPKGYGYVSIKGRNWRVHRLVYENLVGPIPEGLFVCHKCDNRKCCNPDHLFLGTNQDNVRDMVSKGRISKGRRTHCDNGHELSPENVYLEKRRARNGFKRLCRLCSELSTSPVRSAR